MYTIGEQIFTGLYGSTPDARVKVRIGRDVIDRALSSGIDLSDTATDEGLLIESDGDIRYLRSSEPAKSRAAPGDVIEYKADHMARYRKARVSSRAELAGVVTLQLRSEMG